VLGVSGEEPKVPKSEGKVRAKGKGGWFHLSISISISISFLFFFFAGSWRYFFNIV